MSETANLQGEETTASKPSRKRLLFILLPMLVFICGVTIWMMLSPRDEVYEEPEEREEIAAATAPRIVPAESQSVIDVPAAEDAPSGLDRSQAGPTYIPPVVEETPLSNEPLDMPSVDLLATSQYEERRSRLLDALHASPIIEVEPIPVEDGDESDQVPSMDEGELVKGHLLTPGSVIPSVLLQGINSDLPGIAVAQVSRDVFDSKTGTTLLIPRGSRIFGTYSAEPLLSDQRILVTWERIDLPNSEAILLENVVGADASGYAGMQDQVHRRTVKALTVTGLTSLITAGLEHAARSDDPDVLLDTPSRQLVQQPSPKAEAIRDAAQQYGDIVNRVAQRQLEQAPTFTIRAGYEFTIQIAEAIHIAPFAR